MAAELAPRRTDARMLPCSIVPIQPVNTAAGMRRRSRSVNPSRSSDETGMALTRQDLTAALPDLNESIRPLGLRSGAEIWRDQDGIPHITAASAYDAFFVQGFVHAQDRLWHMEYDRRRAYGR